MSANGKEYIDHESPIWLDDIWATPPTRNRPVCRNCGMGDTHNLGWPGIGSVCKWCLELYLLTEHLNRHGSRRLKRVM